MTAYPALAVPLDVRTKIAPTNVRKIKTIDSTNNNFFIQSHSFVKFKFVSRLNTPAYAVNGIIANADNKRLKEKLASAEKTASIWKQRYDALNEKYQELKKKAQPYLDALEIASERVRAFISAVLARGKETRELKTPARKRGQDMEI